MKDRYRLVRRGRTYYAFDRQTGQRLSLETSQATEARRLIHARNEAHIQPQVNGAIAKAYLAAQDPELIRRT